LRQSRLSDFKFLISSNIQFHYLTYRLNLSNLFLFIVPSIFLIIKGHLLLPENTLLFFELIYLVVELLLLLK
jgi:hypothetical protein